MFNAMKLCIQSGNYRLDSMLTRLDRLTANGDLTPEERTELKQLAMAGADALYETDKAKMLAEHERRIKALEDKIKALTGGETEGGDDEEIIDEYVPGKWYYAGDVVTWNGEAYTCIAPDGVVCVWNPDEYPAYWQKVG